MPLAKTDLNLLPLFDAILDAVSVGKAAERVGLSKPAASHALARLRLQVGDPILVRAGQRWVLTPRAAALAPRVRAALGEARGVLTAENAFSARELRREFRIHVTEETLGLVGLRLGHTVGTAAPHVALRFLPPVADEAVALRSEADLALGTFVDPLSLPSCGESQVWHARFDGDPVHAWLRRLVAKIAHGEK